MDEAHPTRSCGLWRLSHIRFLFRGPRSSQRRCSRPHKSAASANCVIIIDRPFVIMATPLARRTTPLKHAPQPAASPRPAAAAALRCRSVPRSAGASCRRRAAVLAQTDPSGISISGGAAPAAAAGADVAASLEVLLQACPTKQVAPDEVLAAMGRVEAAHQKQPQVQGAPL